MSDLTNEFDKLSEKWADDSRFPKLSSLKDQVYHYTDAAGLVGMLSTGKVWLTDHRFLNDKSEVVHTQKLVDDVIEKYSANKSDIIAGFIKSIREWRAGDSNEDTFLFSLSERKDDLSQWRGYAREGMGFAVGFDAEILHKVSRSVEWPYSFSKIEYEHEIQLATLSKAFKEFVDLLEGDPSKSEDERERNIDYAGRIFDWLTDTCGVLNKHKSFASESEWRVLAYADKKGGLIKVRHSGLRLVPYVEIPLQGSGDKLPIKSIGVGPGFVGSEIVGAVETLARQHEYYPEIYFAETPYRRL